MLGLLLTLGLLGSPTPPEPPEPGQERIEGPVAPIAEAPPPSLPSDAPPPPAPPPPERRLNKGQRLLIGAGAAYGLGSAIQWVSVGASGMLAGERPHNTSGVTAGLALGGAGMLEGLVIGAIGARELARTSEGYERGKPLIAGGAVVAGVGGAALVGTGMFWPAMRKGCPIDIGCGLAAAQLSGATLSLGVGMIAYGDRLRDRDPTHHRLSDKAITPLVVGGGLLGFGYIASAITGVRIWQNDPDDPVAQRTRDRLLIPVVGPWIHAAGPDAPLLMALVTGGLGALQIGGAIAIGVGAGIAGRERAGRRERQRVEVKVVPSFDGVTIVGRF